MLIRKEFLMRGSRPHKPNAEYIVIDGIYFYKEGKGKYYLGNTPTVNGTRKAIRAHIYVWEKYNGAVPKGYAVHHIDHNPRNNDISNLVLMKISEHASMHSLEHIDKSRDNMLKTAIPAAAAWHKSNEAKEWHKQHYESTTREKWLKPVTKVCEICGKEYTTVQSTSAKSRFCSNNCKATFRRRSGADKAPRNCAVCGKEFICYKYSKQATCGNNDCIQTLRRPKIVGHRHQESNQ